MVAMLLFWWTWLGMGGESGTVTLEVTGVTVNVGQIRIGVYNSDGSFPEKGKEFKGIERKVSGGSQTITFELPNKKNYAIAVYHDKNNNRNLDKNLMGMPVEKYGFSNNARGTFSAPSFEEAKFYLSDQKKLQITLK